MKVLKMAWVYGWAYLFILRGLLEKFGDWMVEQVDHNDFLAGGLFVWLLVGVAWMAGLVRFGG